MNHLDETSFKILETLSRDIGTEMSINQLIERIGETYGSAYYANVYNKLQQLARDKTIALDKAGNAYRVSLNFYDYWIVDLLTQMEIMKKQKTLADTPRLLLLLSEVETTLKAIPNLSSISAIKPIKNEAVNRLELLIILKEDKRFTERTKLADYATSLMRRAEGTKIDGLILTESEFTNMLSHKEQNPAKEMIGYKVTFFGAQNFWSMIKSVIEKGIGVRAELQETIPAKMHQKDLVYNMARFGYRELGRTIEQGVDFCVEYVVAAMLAKGDARLIEAVPVILAKQKVNYNMLFFIAQKFRLLDSLLGILKTFNEILPQKSNEVGYVIEAMKEMDVNEAAVNKNSIKEKLRLYHAA
jgi:hypothetical protein